MGRYSISTANRTFPLMVPRISGIHNSRGRLDDSQKRTDYVCHRDNSDELAVLSYRETAKLVLQHQASGIFDAVGGRNSDHPGAHRGIHPGMFQSAVMLVNVAFG